MHKKLEAELLLLDIELERTLRNMKKVITYKVSVLAEQREIDYNILIVTTERPQQRQRTMEDF